jgi:hypothetical protein
MIRGDVTKCPYCFNEFDPDLLEEKINRVVYCESCKERCVVKMNTKCRIYIKKYPFKPRKPTKFEIEAEQIKKDNDFLFSLAKKCIMANKAKKKFRDADMQEFLHYSNRKQVQLMRDDFMFQAYMMGYTSYQILKFFELNNARKNAMIARLKAKQYQ